MRHLNKYDLLALALLGLLLLLRLSLALLVVPPVVTDAQGYEAAAFRLAETGSFAYPLMTSNHWGVEDGDLVVTEPGRIALLADARNAYTLPGYSAFRAVIIKAAGSTSASRAWTRLAQAVLSVFCAGLIYLLARRFGSRTGLLALVLAAAYPPFALANSYLQTEVLFTFLLLASVYWFVRWADTLSWADAVAAAVAFGLSLWVRPAMALWAPLAVCLVVLRSGPRRIRTGGQAVVIGLMILLMLAPWWVRNNNLYDRFVPFSTSGALTAIEAIRMDVAVQLPFPWQSEPPTQTAEQAQIEMLTVAAISPAGIDFQSDLDLSDHYRSAVSELRTQLIRDHPWAAAASRIRSIAVSLFWPFAVSPSALGGVPFLVAWLVHGILLALFIAGLALAPRRTDTMLLISIPAYTVLLHMYIIPFHRYYFPAMPVVTVIAAIGLDRMLSNAGVLRRQGRP